MNGRMTKNIELKPSRQSNLFFVLIGLMQLGTRCSDGSCQAHDRPSRDGRLMPAGAALERIPPANRVIFCTAAFRTDEAVWKPKPE